MSKIEVPFLLLNFEMGNIIRAPEYCEPTPPSFGKSKKWKIDIEGTTIEFRLPKHNHWNKLGKAKYPEKYYQIKDLHFRDTHDSDCINDEWQTVNLLSNNIWQFKGPFLTGMLAHIDASFMILKHKVKKERTSYFHPRSFENAIAEFITNDYSKPKKKNQHVNIAPVDWKAYNDLPVNAARFKVISNDSITNYRETEFFIFTLDDNHLAYLVFNHNRSDFNARTKAELDKKIGAKHIIESVNDIVNSVKITLSPEAIAQKEKALDGLKETNVTTSFPPLKWDRDNETFNSSQQKIAAE